MEDDIGNKVVCFYCKEYSKIYSDYPMNAGTNNELNDQTPRCELHFQFSCDKCGISTHFNGISYCPICDKYTCCRCSEIDLKFEDFFYYDCYYELKCHSCNKSQPCLDYAEHQLSHPFQIGARQPSEPLALWVPTSEPDQSKIGSKSGWGSKRLMNLATVSDYIPVEKASSEDARDVWNSNAAPWKEVYGEEGDYHHKNLILPNLLEMINLDSFDPKTTKVLDVGSGFGLLCRKIASKGFDVTGIDYSNKMMDVAIRYEETNPLGINYILGDALKLDNYVISDSFELIISNMVIMDLPEYEKVLELIFNSLKSGGTFVFSVGHPVFSWPGAYTIKLPHDSQKNEDKIWIIDDYFDRRAFKIDADMAVFQILNFRKTFSDYINTLVKTGFMIKEVRELQASEELTRKYPRDAFRDDERVPQTMIFKVIKP